MIIQYDRLRADAATPRQLRLLPPGRRVSTSRTKMATGKTLDAFSSAGGIVRPGDARRATRGSMRTRPERAGWTAGSAEFRWNPGENHVTLLGP